MQKLGLYAGRGLSSEFHIENGETVHWTRVFENTSPLRTPFQHALDLAQDIFTQAQKANLELKLFLSGGIDSEAMARVFLAAGIPFTAVIGRYNNTMNEFDYQSAISFCKEYNIKIQFVDVDVFNFLESGQHLEFGRELGCRSPQLAVHLHMLDQVDGFPVMAGNPIYPIFKNLQYDLESDSERPQLALEQVAGLPGQGDRVYLRFLEKRNRPGIPFFFQSSPELLFSFLKLPITLLALSRGDKTHTYNMKCQMYRAAGFEVQPRAGKFTGFELYRKEYDRRQNTEHGTGFNNLFRRPLEEMNPLLLQQIHLPLPAEIVTALRELRPARLNRRKVVASGLAVAALALFLTPARVLADKNPF